jgi:ferredoxin
VDQELCYGAQNCALAAPGGFTYDSDGKASARDELPASPEQYRDAEETCPAMAIRVKAGGQESLADAVQPEPEE